MSSGCNNKIAATFLAVGTLTLQFYDVRFCLKGNTV